MDQFILLVQNPNIQVYLCPWTSESRREKLSWLNHSDFDCGMLVAARCASLNIFEVAQVRGQRWMALLVHADRTVTQITTLYNRGEQKLSLECKIISSGNPRTPLLPFDSFNPVKICKTYWKAQTWMNFVLMEYKLSMTLSLMLHGVKCWISGKGSFCSRQIMS